MEEFVAKCAKGKRNKYHGNYSIPGKKINRQLENNAIISNMVDEILLNETQKVSAARKAWECLDSDCDDNNIYQVDKMSLKETKNKLEWRKCAFEYKH